MSSENKTFKKLQYKIIKLFVGVTSRTQNTGNERIHLVGLTNVVDYNVYSTRLSELFFQFITATSFTKTFVILFDF